VTTRPLTAEEIRTLRDLLSGDGPDTLANLYGRLPAATESAQPDLGEANDVPHRGGYGSQALINLTVHHLRDQEMKTGWRNLDPTRAPIITRLGVVPALAWWCRKVQARMTAARLDPPAGPGSATINDEAAWLAGVLPFILAQPWAPILARDLFTIRDRMVAIVTGKQPFRPRCLDCRSVHLEPQDEASWWKCPNCGRDYTPQTGLGDLGRRQPPMPAREIAAVLQISPGTIRTWKHRGLIATAGHDPRGRSLYYLADVTRVLGQTTVERSPTA